MKLRYIALMAAVTMFLPASCNPEDQTAATFPELDSFMPEPDVPSQGKSPKRGICTNFRHRDAAGVPLMPSVLGEGVSWCYNWAHTPLDNATWTALKENGMTFYPMVWNAGFSQDNLATFPAADPSSEYILGYNEPNLKDQANMTPATAGQNWPGLVSASENIGMKLVGPAVNYGTLEGYGDPVVWYDEFLQQSGVSIDDIDAIALHSYMPSGESLKSLMIRKFSKYGKPLWLTEYANGEAQDVTTQMHFCQEATIYLEADPAVEKYAWFMDSTGSNTKPHFPMISNDETSIGGQPSSITDLGRLYIGLSTLDKDHWYDVDVNIPAEHYTGQVIEETAGQDACGEYVETNITRDLYGNLEIRNLSGTKWVEYNVYTPEEGTYRIDLRYRSAVETVVRIDCEGAVSAIETLPATTTLQPYSTYGVEMTLPEGRHTVRLTAPVGNLNLNWLRFTSPVK